MLELGCGGGSASVAMAKQGAKVIAVDSSPTQLGHARRLSEREEVAVEFKEGDLADLAFVRADTIDIALSVYALGMVADVDRVLRQVHRVLRPEAPLVVSVPHPVWRAADGGDPPTLRRPYWDRTPEPWDQPAAGGELGADHPRTVADLVGSFVRNGFRVDALLEPEPVPGVGRSRWWREAMRWIPATLIIRGRKVGT